ncbi:lymphocyte antigen 6 complex locus protein G6d isoform X2 [Nannospalax galili]|uniref:lymphocyte antigen 6 complex locus protein G6d isoform X2 n=1 Tax=Nannospalax galili TaxID=1026970 RepID=UPI0004ED18D1|nr:lymphocyte antigen 6 complex locus protein G6d isoform X2 [Nannospalax galili]
MMNPQLVGILLSTLLGAALGNRMRCYDCGGGPSSSCKQTVITCGEASVTLSHHPDCVATHHCNQADTESVRDVTHKNCCFGDLCNSATTAGTVAPACILAAAFTTLAWLLPGL